MRTGGRDGVRSRGQQGCADAFGEAFFASDETRADTLAGQPSFHKNDSGSLTADGAPVGRKGLDFQLTVMFGGHCGISGKMRGSAKKGV